MAIKIYKLRSRLLLVVMIAFILIGTTFAFNSLIGLNNASSMTEDTYYTVEVNYGDTLWSIAQSNMVNTKDVRYAVYEICQANDISAEDLYAGQELIIPSEL